MAPVHGHSASSVVGKNCLKVSSQIGLAPVGTVARVVAKMIPDDRARELDFFLHLHLELLKVKPARKSGFMLVGSVCYCMRVRLNLSGAFKKVIGPCCVVA